MKIENNRVILEYKVWKSTSPIFKINRNEIRFTINRYIFAEKTIVGYEVIDIDEVSNQIISESHFNDEDLYEKEYIFGYHHLKKEDNPLLNNFLEQKQKEVKQTIKELVK